MRKYIVGLVIILFFFALIGLVLFKAVSPSMKDEDSVATTTTDPFKDISPELSVIDTNSPYQTTMGCYKWYLAARSNGAEPFDISDRDEARTCFTQDFLHTWDSVIDLLDKDPLTLTEEINSSLQNGIEISQTGVLQRSVTQEVTLGGQITRTVTVTQDTNGQWRISSVSGSFPTE